MTALITGANSLTGAGIAARRLEDRLTVVAFDIERTRVPPACEFVLGDVRDFDALARAANGCDTGIHLAALAGQAAPANIASVNVVGAIGFLRASQSAGRIPAVLASSAPVHLHPGSAAAGILLPSADEFEVLNLVGSLSGRERFEVDRTEQCLAIRLAYNFANFETKRP